MAFVFLILVFFVDHYCGWYLISIAYCPFFHCYSLHRQYNSWRLYTQNIKDSNRLLKLRRPVWLLPGTPLKTGFLVTWLIWWPTFRCPHSLPGRRSYTRSCLIRATCCWRPARGSRCSSSMWRRGLRRSGGRNIAGCGRRKTHFVDCLRKPNCMESKNTYFTATLNIFGKLSLWAFSVLNEAIVPEFYISRTFISWLFDQNISLPKCFKLLG